MCCDRAIDGFCFGFVIPTPFECGVCFPLFFHLIPSIDCIHLLTVCLDSLNAAAVLHRRSVGFKMLEYFLFVFFFFSLILN